MSDVSTIAAWWGAIIATSVLVWDVYKWKRRGPNVVIRVQGDMTCMQGSEAIPGKWITTRVANVGDGPTTLESLGLLYYRNLWSWIRRKPDQSFWTQAPGFSQQLPFKLESGATWDGRGEQTPDLIAKANDGYLFCSVLHSSSKRPVTCRVRIRKSNLRSRSK